MEITGIAFIIFPLSFLISIYYQRKAYYSLKEEYKPKFPTKSIYPISFSNNAYKDKLGIKYKNITIGSLLICFITFVAIIIIVSSTN